MHCGYSNEAGFTGDYSKMLKNGISLIIFKKSLFHIKYNLFKNKRNQQMYKEKDTNNYFKYM